MFVYSLGDLITIGFIAILLVVLIICVLMTVIDKVLSKLKAKKYEYVDHPSHYNVEGKKECIEEMIDKWGKETVATWCEITAFKYKYRCGSKPNNSISQEKRKIDWYENKAKELRECE